MINVLRKQRVLGVLPLLLLVRTSIGKSEESAGAEISRLPEGVKQKQVSRCCCVCA